MLTEYLKKSSLKPDYLTIFTSFAFLICPYSAAFNLQTLSSKGHRKLGNSDWEIKLGQCKNGKFFGLSSNTYGLRLIVIHGQKVLESSHHCIWSNKRILHSAMGTFSSTSTKNQNTKLKRKSYNDSQMRTSPMEQPFVSVPLNSPQQQSDTTLFQSG